MKDINLEKVIEEMDNVMEQARHTPNGCGAMLRNSVVSTMVDYMNNLQNLHTFQESYKIKYTTDEEVKQKIDYTKIQDGYITSVGRVAGKLKW